MMSKQSYLNDRAGRWHPHLMLFVPQIETSAWGAGLAGAPVFGVKSAEERLTIFYVPVGTWSDGSPADHSYRGLPWFAVGKR